MPFISCVYFPLFSQDFQNIRVNVVKEQNSGERKRNRYCSFTIRFIISDYYGRYRLGMCHQSAGYQKMLKMQNNSIRNGKIKKNVSSFLDELQ